MKKLCYLRLIFLKFSFLFYSGRFFAFSILAFSRSTPLRSTWGFEDSSYAARTLRAAGYRTMGVYDSDLAGTYEDLAAICDRVVRGFGELDADEFVAWSVAPQASSSFPA